MRFFDPSALGDRKYCAASIISRGELSRVALQRSPKTDAHKLLTTSCQDSEVAAVLRIGNDDPAPRCRNRTWPGYLVARATVEGLT